MLVLQKQLYFHKQAAGQIWPVGHSVPTPAVRPFPPGGVFIPLCSSLHCELFENSLSHIYCFHLNTWYTACPFASHQPTFAKCITCKIRPPKPGVGKHANWVRGELSPMAAHPSPSYLLLSILKLAAVAFLTTDQNNIPVFVQRKAMEGGSSIQMSTGICLPLRPK